MHNYRCPIRSIEKKNKEYHLRASVRIQTRSVCQKCVVDVFVGDGGGGDGGDSVGIEFKLQPMAAERQIYTGAFFRCVCVQCAYADVLNNNVYILTTNDTTILGIGTENILLFQRHNPHLFCI